MSPTVTTTVHPLVKLACSYADSISDAMGLLATEQEIREVLVGALLTFMDEGMTLAAQETSRCHRTGTPAA